MIRRMQPHFAILSRKGLTAVDCHVLVAISADGSQRAQGKDMPSEAELETIKEERSCKGSACCVQSTYILVFAWADLVHLRS